MRSASLAHAHLLPVRLPSLLAAIAAVILCANASANASAADATRPVFVAHLEGVVDPISARYLHHAVTAAQRDRAAALVITVNTPGGLDTSMRQIVQDLLGSSVPTIAFVWPPGSRAASAGVFITQAANLVAMAPGTNIGAAHPVAGGGSTISGDLRDKITNDAAAYIASIAKQRGRNDAWVQDAVRNSVSLDAQQALDDHVADLIAADLSGLLRAVDGRLVSTAAGEVPIRTGGAPIADLDMNPFELALQKVVDPNVAYILFTIGIYAILIELFHPGSLVPGFTGAICLILALVAFATLPLNVGGALLILVAVALFVLDVKATAHGGLTLAGLACFVVGSLMLYNPPGPRSPSLPVVAVALPVLIACAATGAVLCMLVVGAAIRVRRRRPISGAQLLIGATGVAGSVPGPGGAVGTVRVHGQLWSARARHGVIKPGQAVRVLARNGLTLEVEPSGPGARGSQET